MVFCDNQGAVCLSKDKKFHERTKNIDVKFHFIRDVVRDKKLCVEKVHTDDNAIVFFTKIVPGSKFHKCLKLLSVVHNDLH